MSGPANEKMSLPELKAMARNIGMSTGTKLNKRAELIRAINSYVARNREMPSGR